jgi:hypothetical protein
LTPGVGATIVWTFVSSTALTGTLQITADSGGPATHGISFVPGK